jgi:hypothetical protein
MPKHQQPIEAPNVGAAALSSDIPFQHRDFNTAQLKQIFGCEKTTLFEKIIPQLEELGGVYHEGGRVKANGAAILALRARKLAELRVSRPMPKNYYEKRKRRSRKPD